MAYISKEATDLRNQLRIFQKETSEMSEQELDVFLSQRFFPFVERNKILKYEYRKRAEFLDDLHEDANYRKLTDSIDRDLKRALHYSKITINEWREGDPSGIEALLQPYEKLQKVLASLVHKNVSIADKRFSQKIIAEIDDLKTLVRGQAETMKVGVFGAVELYRRDPKNSDRSFLPIALIAVMRELDDFLSKESIRSAHSKPIYISRTKTFLFNKKEYPLTRKNSKYAVLCDAFFRICPKSDKCVSWRELHREIYGTESGSPIEDRESIRNTIRALNRWAADQYRLSRILKLEGDVVWLCEIRVK